MLPNKANLDITTECSIYQPIQGDQPILCCQNSFIGNHPSWITDWAVICLRLECSYIGCGLLQ